MSIMPPHRDHPLSTSRLIASSVLRALDDDRDDVRLVAFNSLFRLASAMRSHRFHGVREPDYAELAQVLDLCIVEASGGPAEEGYADLLDALRRVAARGGSAQDDATVRTMARTMARRLENA